MQNTKFFANGIPHLLEIVIILIKDKKEIAFSKDDELIKILKEEKHPGARWCQKEFRTRNWSIAVLNRLVTEK